jgi:hypothetical protein
LNGTEDETLPPATVDANRTVMEPYAKDSGSGGLKACTITCSSRTPSKS